ncbi:unnamed protein product [Cylicocyclus nassatus]|uniref:Ionotropic glutamate receptor C-terminal domain-containing protein n=1 Tax=Cylicocyclus nassatus TaxID=53992 RepID=A0AA36HBL5_CYLNA|nr:unnamed protein product [Cylicocyclus nassatus]
MEVILLLVVAGFMVGCLLHLFTKLLTKDSSSLSDCAFCAFAAIFNNSNLDKKELLCFRLLVSAWLMFAFMLTQYYGAKLQSFLLLTHYRGALFENMDQAMDAMEYHVDCLYTSSS